MTERTQRNTEPYAIGDCVEITLGLSDGEDAFHGQKCLVVDHFWDPWIQQRGEHIDAVSYLLQPVDSNQLLIPFFRHHDLKGLSSR